MRNPLLLSTLFALGVMPVLPPPRRDVDLAAAEKLITDLQAVDIDAAEMVQLTGAVDFVVKGRLALQVHETKKAMGEHDVRPLSLLGVVDHLLAGGTAPGFEHGIVDLSDGKPHEIRHEGKLLATVRPHAGAIGMDVMTQLQTVDRDKLNYDPLDTGNFTRVEPSDWKLLDYLHPPGVFLGVDMAAPGRFDRTAITLVANMDSELAETVKAKTTWASLCAMPREPRTHNRPTQRAAKKTRARTKARRGW